MKHIKIVLAVALLSGCEAKVDDLQVFIAEVKQTTTVNIEPYPEFASKPTFATFNGINIAIIVTHYSGVNGYYISKANTKKAEC